MSLTHSLFTLFQYFSHTILSQLLLVGSYVFMFVCFLLTKAFPVSFFNSSLVFNVFVYFSGSHEGYLCVGSHCKGTQLMLFLSLLCVSFENTASKRRPERWASCQTGLVFSKFSRFGFLLSFLNYVLLVYPSMSFYFFSRFVFSFGVWQIIKVGPNRKSYDTQGVCHPR